MNPHLVRSLVHVFIVNRRIGERFLTSDAHIYVAERYCTPEVPCPDLAALIDEALINDESVDWIRRGADGRPAEWERIA